MGCSPLLSRALKSLRGKRKEKEKKEKKEEKKHKSKKSRKERLARSVSQGHQNAVHITHPAVEISTATTWEPPPPHNPALDTSTPQPAAHLFPGTPDTKKVVQVHYADTNAYDRYPAHDAFGPKDPFYYRRESDFGCYSYHNPSVTGRDYEESSSSSSKPEYLCGEYQYYPTPVREGIYSLTTDGNRLTNIFSDENPNACNIV